MINRAYSLFTACAACLMLHSTAVPAQQAEGNIALGLVADVGSLAYVEQIDSSVLEVRNHEVGLGALQKVRGRWRLDDSERISGQLERHTWRVLDGYTSEEVFLRVADRLEQLDEASLIFRCEARACGPSVQWANRMFSQRVLYGTEESQRYRVYALKTGAVPVRRMLLYASARTADRQYLHIEVLSGERIESAL